MTAPISNEPTTTRLHHYAGRYFELEVVADNERAVSLYRCAGFEEYGRNPRGYRSAAAGYQELVHMRLEL